MIEQAKGSEKQLAVQRATYIKKLKITVKASQKTQDLDQLIVIETYNTQKKQSVELIMRKFSELDYFVEYLNEKYGGHIIPFIKSDFFFQNDIKVSEVVPKIEEYLADLQHNRYCRQDQKFYCFILEQNMSFPKAIAYNKVLNHATDFSRKYLSSLFARKTIPHIQNTEQYIQAYQTFQKEYKIYQTVKEVIILKIKQILQIQQILELFADFNNKSEIAIEPFELEIQNTWNIIKVADKLIKQADEAHARWEILIQHTRQLENNVCKGLHEDAALFDKKLKQVNSWNKSLSCQFLQLCSYLDEKMQKISNTIKRIYGSVVEQSIRNGTKDSQMLSAPQRLEEYHRHRRRSISNEIRQYEKIESIQKIEKLRKSSSQVRNI